MGVPLLVALLGARAAGPAIVTILVDLLFTSSLCIALSRLGSVDKHGAAVAARNALRGVAANPMPWAIVLGATVSALPSASNVAMLAERFGADNGRIARIILVSTALAFLTFSGAVALLI